jgi:hypothetical protein
MNENPNGLVTGRPEDFNICELCGWAEENLCPKAHKIIDDDCFDFKEGKNAICLRRMWKY